MKTMMITTIDDDDDYDEGLRVTTKMYTVAMDTWAKSQHHPSFLFHGDGAGRSSHGRDAHGGGSFGFEGKCHKPQQQQQKQPSQEFRQQSYEAEDRADDNNDDDNNDDDDNRNIVSGGDRQYGSKGHNRQQKQEMPLGVVAQWAHRIHMSLVETHAHTGDVHLAPSQQQWQNNNQLKKGKNNRGSKSGSSSGSGSGSGSSSGSGGRSSV